MRTLGLGIGLLRTSVPPGGTASEGTVITSQAQLYSLMTSYNSANPTNQVNQSRLYAYMSDQSKTQADLIAGDITEEDLTAWWDANPSGIS